MKKIRSSLVFYFVLLSVSVLVALYNFNYFDKWNAQLSQTSSPVCGDGVCGAGESAFLCPFDCAIDLNKNVKIFFASGNFGTLTHYLNNGSKEVINNKQSIKDFLKDKISSTSSDGVWGEQPIVNPEKLIGYKYFELTNAWDINWDIAYPEYNQHEDWFVHADGVPETKENRIMWVCSDQFLLNFGSAGLRESVARQANEWLQNSFADGIFIDNAAPKAVVDLWSRWWRKVVDETGVVDSDGLIHPSFPITSFNCPENIIKVVDETANEIPVLSHSTNSINVSAENAGKNVKITYFVDSRLNQVIDNNWDALLAGAFTYIKSQIGNKLLIFNGVYSGILPEAKSAISSYLSAGADGGFDEQFLPYSSGGDFPTAMSSESTWLNEIENMYDVSKSKIYLAQMRLTAPITEQEKNDYALYAFASYLLGKNDYAFFNFTTDRYYSDYVYYDYWDADLGKPMEKYHLRANISGSNIYQREYERALVLVNPGTSVASINLGKNYYLTNGSITNSATLKPESGIILLNFIGCGDGICQSGETCSSCTADCAVCPVECNPSWSCGAWSTCTNNQQSRTCTDSNNCGVTTGRPNVTQSCTSVCTPNWQCESWSVCANAQQNRACTDSNNCNQIIDKPPTSQSCIDQVQIQTTIPAQAPVDIFTKKLYLRVRDDQVSALQTLLAKDSQIYPEAKITGYYWTLTFKAVGRFQLKYGILAGPKSAGYGMVGPKTRAKLNEINRY